jgi:hypothetical protein
MTIRENILARIPFQTRFSGMYVLDKSKDWILNTIKICGIEDNCIDGKSINFDISSINNRIIISPLEKYDDYFLVAEYLCFASVVEIKSDDYIDVIKQSNGNYLFTMKKGDLNDNQQS